MKMKSTDVSAISGIASSSSDFGSTTGSSSSWGSEYMFITAIWHNERNYPLWAKSVEVYLMAKRQDKYFIDASLGRKNPSYAA